MSLALVLIMLATSFSVAATGMTGAEQVSASDGIGSENADALLDAGDSKLDAALESSIAESNERQMVYVVVNDVDAANEVLTSLGLDTISGKLLSGVPTIRMMELDPIAIVALAKSDGVTKIMRYEQPATEPARLELSRESVSTMSAYPATEDYDINEVHGAVASWESGFTGEGVKLAVIDDGFDMAHPDLQGQQARYEFGPYDGWPIAYEDYGAYRWAEGKIGGWIADTTLQVTPIRGAHISFDDEKYRVKGLRDAQGDVVMSVSGVYHVGYHPDPTLEALWGGKVAVLVVDTETAGVYDTVYVDVMRDFDFTNDKPCTKGDEISYFDSYDAATGYLSDIWNGGDGFADYSGGMVSWISDGINVYPASDWMYGADFLAGSGDAVAFIGAFAGTHGTMTSSSALATGTTMGGQLGGMAPGAKLICIPFTGSTVNAWMFAQFGADGMLGTGDEATLVSNSYGWSDTAVDAGYQLMDMIATTISLTGPTLWFWSTGNGGPGYGTAHSVVDVTSVHVGAGTTMQYRYWLGYELAPGYQKWGDVAPFSNSGPGRNGKLNAEIIASGMYSLEPSPLNVLSEIGTIGDGSMHFQVGSGTSHATPTAAGGAALGYQAFVAVHGDLPQKDVAKALLMAAADDMHSDPFKQGAGWLNADTYTQLMSEAAGTASIAQGAVFATSALYPGGVDGQKYETFPNFVLPGQEVVESVTTYNFGSEPATVEIAPELLLKSYEETLTVMTSQKGDTYVDITEFIPATTDLLKLTMYMPFSQFDPEMDYVSNVEYWLEMHDWVDLNGNGRMDVSAKKWELFRYTVDGSDCNANQVTIKDPIERTTDGLIVRVRAITPARGIEVSLQLDCYELEKFPWMKVREVGATEWSSSISVEVPAMGTTSWEALVSVPMDAKIGSYGAAIYIDDGSRIQSMPVLINVPATDYEFEFGGESSFDTPYNNDVTGVSDKYWRFEVGDWRIFWSLPTELPDPNGYLMASVEWSELPTDINVHVLAPVATDDFWHGVFESPLGPGYFEQAIASSDERYMGAGKFGIYTNTGGPKEVVAAPLGAYETALGTPAPFAIVTRCPIMSGESSSVTLYGETKWVVMNDYQPREVNVEIDLSEGDLTIGSVPAWYDITIDEMIEVAGAGVDPMVSNTWDMEPIYQDILTSNFDADLANAAYTRAITVQAASILTVSVWEVADCPDIDLALWYDANMNGIADDATYWYVGTGGSSESLTLRGPADGQYLVKVLGYTVTGEPGYFGLSVLQGIQGAAIAAVDLEPEVGTGMHEFNIVYSVPAVPGVYVGAATFGFMGANDMFSIRVVLTVVE
ncbi:MAG TPA: S8 family serine peptidase [Candidatus Paceibacterota bacterium]|nr:S8 family serine peptidase [Candidatus Paceibacterota bacterium]